MLAPPQPTIARASDNDEIAVRDKSGCFMGVPPSGAFRIRNQPAPHPVPVGACNSDAFQVVEGYRIA